MNKQKIHAHILAYLAGKKFRPHANWYLKALASYPKEIAFVQDALGTKVSSTALYEFLFPECTKSCRSCGKPTKWVDISLGYAHYCSSKCSNGSPDVKARKERTYVERYGVTAPAKSKAIRAKQTATTLERYGVDNPFQSEAIRTKQKATIRNRYGVENVSQNAEIKRRKAETTLRNYGVDHPMKSADVRAGAEATRLAKYGVRHALQDPETLAKMFKTAHRYKYVTHGNRTFALQGYEPQALDLLISNGVSIDSFEDIKCSISYVDKKGKQRRYIPDFMVAGKLVIEIKSPRLFENFRGELDALESKYKGVRAAGYDYALMVLDASGKVVCARINNIKDLAQRKVNVESFCLRVLSKINSI